MGLETDQASLRIGFGPVNRTTDRLEQVLVSGAPMLGGNHKDDSFLIVDLIEETPGPDTISPCVRRVAFELSNVGTEMGVLPEPWIDDLLELCYHLALARSRNRP